MAVPPSIIARKALFYLLSNEENWKWIILIILLPVVFLVALILLPALMLGVLTSTPMVDYDEMLNLYKPVVEQIELETRTKKLVYKELLEGKELQHKIDIMRRYNTGQEIGEGVTVDLVYLLSIDAIIHQQDFSKATKEKIKKIADLFIYDEIKVEIIYIPGSEGSLGRFETHIYRYFHKKTVQEVLEELVSLRYIKEHEVEDILFMIEMSQDLVYASGDYEPEIEGAYGWIWPTPSTKITSPFGPRKSPVSGASTFHKGVDIGAMRAGVAGDPVWAMDDGVVFVSKYGIKAGNFIEIHHGNQVKTRYLHLHSRNVRSGQQVKKGDLIGTMGASGIGTGVHLHFEIHYNNNVVNPLGYFPGIQ